LHVWNGQGRGECKVLSSLKEHNLKNQKLLFWQKRTFLSTYSCFFNWIKKKKIIKNTKKKYKKNTKKIQKNTKINSAKKINRKTIKQNKKTKNYQN
jgi:hypothetical protein